MVLLTTARLLFWRYTHSSYTHQFVMAANGLRPQGLLPFAIPPVAPNFHFCHPFYGESLVQQDCERAASYLPTGNIPILVYSHDYPFAFPIVESAGRGRCRLTIRWANPDSLYWTSPPEIGEIRVAPDAFRTIARWLITACVSQFRNGGFGTVGLENMIRWIANDTTPFRQIGEGPFPAYATYFTVTIDRDDGTDGFNPGYHDPAIAQELGDGVIQEGSIDRGDTIIHASEVMQRSHQASQVAQWWYLFANESSDSTYSTEMVYSCDVSLGAPKAADCSQLAYSGLGPPSDTLTVGPGQTRLLSLNLCHATITAIHSIVLTWALISASLNTLVDSCVTHPWMGSRGGRAFHSNSKPSKGRKRATAAINGLDALPPGVTITVSS